MDSSLSGYTILIADDERYVVRTIALKLRQAGATVITASDGQEALEVATCQLPDLICTDYQMFPMDGLTLARKLKRIASTAHIPILLLNSHSHRISPSQLADTNVRALMPKPFSTRELLGKMQELAFDAGVAA